MTTPKTFAASTTTDLEAATEQFTLEGVYAKGRTAPDGQTTTWSETFEANSEMQASQAQWYASAFIIVDGKQQVNPPAVIEFVALACTPESQVRFRALVDDPDRLVGVGPIGSVFVWLTEEVIARPTAPPSA